MEQSYLPVKNQPLQLQLLCSEFQFDQLHEHSGEEDARTERRRQDCGKIKANRDELGRNCLDKFFIRAQSDCVGKPGDTRSIYREAWREGKKQFKTRCNVEFSRMAKGCTL